MVYTRIHAKVHSKAILPYIQAFSHTVSATILIINKETQNPYIADICTISKDPGPCTDYEPVWYFEPNSRTCRRFLYGGCEGNGNRFDSRLACEESCLFPPGHVTTVPPTWHPHTTKATPTESSIGESGFTWVF